MKRLFSTCGLALALTLVTVVVASAQTGTARGKVVDEQGQTLEGVTVVLEFKGGVTRKHELKTNKKGEYTQVGLYPGNYKITASKEGYETTEVSGRVNLGDPTYFPDLRIVTKKVAAQAAVDKGAAELQATFKKANDLAQAGQLAEAEAAYKEVGAKNPNIPEVSFNLGYIYAQKKDWASAEASYRKAIELRPGYGEAYVALARVLQESGQNDKALELLNQAAAANQNDARVQFSLGIWYLNAGKPDLAEPPLRKAAELEPTNAEIFYYLGTLSVQQNKVPEAITNLEKYLSMSPQNPTNVATAQALIAALKPKK